MGKDGEAQLISYPKAKAGALVAKQKKVDVTYGEYMCTVHSEVDYGTLINKSNSPHSGQWFPDSIPIKIVFLTPTLWSMIP